jgi:hypothetical protein
MGVKTQYEEAATAGVEWLAAQLNDDGSYGEGIDDLACYYKSPYLFHLSGRAREASRLLTFIDLRFGREDHDFATSADQKSDNAAFNEYWAYPNGWIAMAAQRMGRFDIAYPAFTCLLSFHRPDVGGFVTNRPQGRGEAGTDVFTTAHLGLVCLYFGDIQRASAAGRFVARVLAMQRETLSDGFLLRLDSRGNLVRDIPEAAAAFYVVRVEEPDQAYFMILPHGFFGQALPSDGRRRPFGGGTGLPRLRSVLQGQSSDLLLQPQGGLGCRRSREDHGGPTLRRARDCDCRSPPGDSGSERRLAHRPTTAHHVRSNRGDRHLAQGD